LVAICAEQLQHSKRGYMPNYIHINLSIMGKDQRLGEFTRRAKGARKPTGDLPTFPDGRANINYDCAENPPTSVFEFDRLIPLPESYSQFPYSSHGYNLEVQTWGIKWGAFAHKPPKFREGCATYWFTCAWEAPRIFLEKVSLNWPDLWFVVSYGGEGPIRGRFALHNGEYIENIADDTGPSFDDMSDEEWEEQSEAWVNAYQNAHEEYTKHILSAYILEQTVH
jgi:hypothetical protein